MDDRSLPGDRIFNRKKVPHTDTDLENGKQPSAVLNILVS